MTPNVSGSSLILKTRGTMFVLIGMASVYLLPGAAAWTGAPPAVAFDGSILSIVCETDGGGIECGVCTSDPSYGLLPVSTGGQGQLGVGVAVGTRADSSSPTGFSFGPYLGAYAC